ncbi:hypothetical protein [Agreia sp.]|uniref:hypothetical protein n=1 Tax=Agreia sp. TaxID=1872416 RepID=UPI0035BC096C
MLRPGARAPRFARTGILAAGLLGLCACQGPVPLDALPQGVTVDIQQNRDDYGPRRLEIKVANESDATIKVTRATVESSVFATGSSTTRTSEIPRGVTRDLRVVLKETVCAPATPEETRVRIEFETAGGRVGEATVTPGDRFGAITRVHAQDCLEETALSIIDIEPSETLRVVDVAGVPTAQLDFAITPRQAAGAAGTITIESIARTILLRPPSSDSWPVGSTFAATSDTAVVTLDVLPNNCNTHTVAEDKRGTFFPFQVSTGAGGEGIFYIGVSDAVRGQFYDYIAHDYCHWS